MYTQQELNEVSLQAKKRLLIVLVPAAAVLLAAIAVFVYGQQARSEKLWLVTVVLTVLSIGSFLFFWGTWIKPARRYARHINYMLNGRKVTTTGHFLSISDEESLQETLPFFVLTMNVGDQNDPNDERLFYFDAQKTFPPCKVGQLITIESNDRKISSITFVE